MEIKVFNYIKELDCFVVNAEFKSVCDFLGLRGWEQKAWIGRYFTLDNDYGEHWFDNWELRDKQESRSKELGIEYDEMLIIDPKRLRDGKDGPCHSDQEIKLFWTSVLTALTLNLDVIIAEARRHNKGLREAQLMDDEDYLKDLEDRILQIKS